MENNLSEEELKKITELSAYFSRERRAVILLEEATKFGIEKLPPELLRAFMERMEKEKMK